MIGILSFLILVIVLIYGTFSTIFHDTVLVGHIGKIIGDFNTEFFGYFAYIDFLFILIPLYVFYSKPYMLKRLEGYVGWILLIISIILFQTLIFASKGGLAGMQIYNTLYPLIGKAGLWLFWIMIFTISIMLIVEELPNIKGILSSIVDSIQRLYYKSKISILELFVNDEIVEEREIKNSKESTIVKFFSEIKNGFNYLFRPHKQQEIEKILEMKLDDIDISKNRVNRYRDDEYIESVNRDIDRVDDFVSQKKQTKYYQETIFEDEIEEDKYNQEYIPPIQEEEKIEIVEPPRREKRVDSRTPKVATEESVNIETRESKKENKNKKPKLISELEENKKLLASLEKGKLNKPKNFKLPKIDFLTKPPKNHQKIDEAEIDRKISELLSKLEKFKIEGDVIRTYSGPLVTTFEFKPAPNVKVSKILGLQDDLAMALRAETIRIQAPIPGKDVVGIEIPNDTFDTIYLRDILESDLFKNSKSPLTVALGKDIVGNPFITDLKKLPHLLIAGTTGSGKSVGINAMLLSLLYRNDPDHLKLIMIDPKMLEFSIYDDIPHLLTPVITEPKKAIAALANTVGEMERRYKLMAENRVKNIDNYNQKMQKEGNEELPYIVIVIDELADLMMTGGKEVEYSIARLAQMARAAGIHLIIATQRPSVDVVTGLIKANLPSRLSYRVGQKIDSKVILDQMGAESLLGRGDALFTPPNMTGLVRIHAPWNTEEEIDRIVEFLKAQRSPEYDNSFLENKSEDGGNGDNSIGSGDLDPLYEKAKEVVLTDRKTSISYLQRKLQIGYNRSANIIDQLEKTGVLSAPNNKGQREIIE